MVSYVGPSYYDHLECLDMPYDIVTISIVIDIKHDVTRKPDLCESSEPPQSALDG